MTTQAFPLPPGATAAQPSGEQQFSLPPGATPVDSAATGSGGASNQDPATQNGMGGDPVSGGIAESAASTAGGLWNAVAHPVSAVLHMTPLGDLSDSIKQSVSLFDAYEKARAGGASVGDAMHAANQQAQQQDAALQNVKARIDEFKKTPGQATVRALADVAQLAAGIYGGAEAPEEAAEAAPEAAAAEGADATASQPAAPNLVQKLYKGADAAQPQAQSALRTGAADAAADSGVESALDPKQGIRTLADDTIAKTKTAERGLYDQINEAAGTDLKTHYEKLAKINDAIDASVDPAEEARLELARTQRMDTIADAEKQAVANGVNPDTLKQAEALTQQRYAVQEVKAKLFNNENVVNGDVAHGAPESINVDNAINAAQKLNKPSKFAPEGSPTRLQQALGKEGANNLLKNLYNAQKTGKAAVNAQKVAGWAGGATTAVLGGAAGIYELMK